MFVVFMFMGAYVIVSIVCMLCSAISSAVVMLVTLAPREKARTISETHL